MNNHRKISVQITPILLLITLFMVKITTGNNSSEVLLYNENTHHTNHSLVKLRLESFPQLYAFMYRDSAVNVNFTIVCPDTSTVYRLVVVTDDLSVAFIRGDQVINMSCSNTSYYSEAREKSPGEFQLNGTFSLTLGTDLLGRTWLDMYLLENEDGLRIANNTIPFVVTKTDSDVGDGHYLDPRDRILRLLVVVIRPLRYLDRIFQVIVYIIIISSTIGMGCKTELEVVRTVLKRPIAPAIGFFCQYACMPLIAFGIAKSIKFDNPAVAVGIFACGICPGGGVSNLYCYVLNGDVSLSVTMTTISTIAALGMIPFWMFTLGSLFNDDKTQINIPYLNIIITLALVIVPLFLGMIIKYKCLKVSKIILKIIKPLTLISIVILLSFGIYVNLYIFRLFSPTHILAGCLLPYFGYIIGGVVALIFRQPWARVKTIAIETGIQNVGVAFLMLMTSLAPPDGDLAAVGPAASGIMTPLPLFVVSIIYVTYNKCRGKKYESVPTKDGKTMSNSAEVNGNTHKLGQTKEIVIKETVSSV